MDSEKISAEQRQKNIDKEMARNFRKFNKKTLKLLTKNKQVPQKRI